VDNAPVVGVGHRVADGYQSAQQLAQGQAVLAGVPTLGVVEAPDRGVEGFALDEAHGVAGPAVLVADQAVGGDDSRVFQPGGDGGLAQEAAADAGVCGVAFLDALEGHLALELLVVGHQDLAQPAPGVKAQRPVAHPPCPAVFPGARRGRSLGQVRRGSLVREAFLELGFPLGEALEIFGGRQVGLAAAAQVVLGGDQVEEGGGLAGQDGEALQVGLDAHGLACLEAALQVDVDQLGQGGRVVGRGKVLQRRGGAGFPGPLEAPKQGSQPVGITAGRHGGNLRWGKSQPFFRRGGSNRVVVSLVGASAPRQKNFPVREARPGIGNGTRELEPQSVSAGRSPTGKAWRWASISTSSSRTT
jgi:hypothetical protein